MNEPTKNDIAAYRTRNERSRLLDEVHDYLNSIPNGDLDVAKRALHTIQSEAMRLDLRYAAGRFYVLQPDGLWEMDDEQDNATTTLLQRWCETECNVLDVFDRQLRAAWAANVASGDDDQAWNESYNKARDRFKDTRKYWRSRVQSRQSRKNILDDLRGLPGVRVPDGPDAFDANPDVLAVANGLLNLRTGELRSLRASDMVTQRLRVAYRPDAEAPRWHAFLREVLLDEEGRPDEELIAWLQRLIGYAATGHATEQVFVLLTGKGANGKGVFTRALRHVLAAVTKSAQVETFAQTRAGSGASGDLARLSGARLVLASEPEAGTRFKAGLIKQLTGGDPVTARHLYRPEFEFMPKFVVLISTNSLPTAIDASDGYWRRARVVPFRRQFAPEDRDRNIDAKLDREAEGILRWVVDGARAWYEDGLGASQAVEAEVRTYRAANDRLAEFISDRLEITGNHSDAVLQRDVWAAYVEWAADLHEDTMQRQTLYNAIGERSGVRRTTLKGRDIFRGVRLLGVHERKQREVEAEKALRPLSVA